MGEGERSLCLETGGFRLSNGGKETCILQCEQHNKTLSELYTCALPRQKHHDGDQAYATKKTYNTE